MINSHSASTFAQITHRGADSISNSFPTEIGICYTPIPITSIRPETSVIPGDNIPRCSICSAFFNKFNSVERGDLLNQNKFRCSLCGEYTTTNISLEVHNNHNAECLLKNEVYEALVHRSYFKRRAFIPTDFYIFSLDLLRTKPTLFDTICNSYASCFQPKQVGIAFVHGAITVVKFRPSIALQTFSDDIPIVKESQLFASAAFFRDSLPKIKTELLSLKPIENIEYTKNFIEFGINVSTRFGSSLIFVLNESDFHNVAHLDTLKFEALNMCTKYAQASACIFSEEEIKYRNPLIDLVSFTGGFLKVFISKQSNQARIHNTTTINNYSNINNSNDNNNNDNNAPSTNPHLDDAQNGLIESNKSIHAFSDDDNIFEAELVSLLNPSLYHDPFLFVRPPDCGDIIDYAGSGFLKTNTGVCLAKIQAGDTFYFTINASKIVHPFIQFVTYYTTANNERRIRVATLPLMTLPVINTELLRCYAAAMVAQRIIAEDLTSASEYLKSLKKKFSSSEDQQQKTDKMTKIRQIGEIDTLNQQQQQQNQDSLLKSIFTPFSSIYSYLTSKSGTDDIDDNIAYTNDYSINLPNVFDKANELINYTKTERSQFLDLYCTCIEYRSGIFLRRRIQTSRPQSPLQQQQQKQQSIQNELLDKEPIL